MTDWPFVSVVIPMRNEAETIGALLDGVLAQDYPATRFEVLVVDGDSGDGAAAVVQAYAQRDPRVRLLHNPRRIVPTALNVGIRAARGDIVCRLDGHTRVATDYVRIGVETLQRTSVDNVGGPMHAVGGGWFGDAVAAASSSRFGIGSYFHYGTEEREVDTVYLGMWPRRVFERVGLFDEELVRNQDDEFNYRLRKAGGRVLLTPRMRSWYQNRRSLVGLLRQYYQYGQWKVRVLQKHPLQMSWRHFVPPAFVIGLGGLTVVGSAVPLAADAARAVFGLYAALVLAVAARLALRRGVRAWLATALAFASLHAAWGAGFVNGLFIFAGRWRTPEGTPPRLERRDRDTAAPVVPVACASGGSPAGRTP
jgi:glycosyltransferase involved in cell wall biosynthesis